MKSRISGKALEGASRRSSSQKRGRGRERSSELRFRRLFETAKDGILILDGGTHTILEANPYLGELLGIKPNEMRGKDLGEIGVKLQDKEVDHAFAHLEKGGTMQFEHTLPGDRMRVLEFVCNCYEENGRALIQCNIRDIAQRKEDEWQLREALQQLAATKQELETRVQERTADLQQRNAELEAFSYSLSHDLRAPIRAIVSFTQLALEEYGPRVGAPATEYLQKAISAAQRLDHLILDVLAFSKTTRQKLVPERIDVEQLLKEILQERPEWSSPNAKVIIESPLLPIIGDRASLTQCLTNLLDNAVKFVPAGVMPRIQVSTRRVASRVNLCIADNGIGIPEAAQNRIFELFQRAHNGYEGYGIGLAIVRRAADRMHGTVSVSSVQGKGSTFCVELPAPD
jgi:PAS domain S-box-containing protein